MHLTEKLFGFSPSPVGITQDGRIVSRQRFVSGDAATQNEVDEFLLEAGLIPARQSCWLWKVREAVNGLEEWVGDARSDNFVRTKEGIVPIDVRMWQVYPSAE
jgi:hypothetical protein